MIGFDHFPVRKNTNLKYLKSFAYIYLLNAIFNRLHNVCYVLV